MDSSTQCAVGSRLGGLDSLSPFGQITSALSFLLLSSSKEVSSFGITNMSVAPSGSWYLSLSPFETIMLGLIVLKVMLLRYLNILPIDVTKLVKGENPFGQRKMKRSVDLNVNKEKERLAETMFTVLRRLDTQDCLLRTICELQVHSLSGNQLPRETKLTLSALSKSGWNRKAKLPLAPATSSPDFIEERTVLSVFEEAVEVGWEAKGNGTDCQERYFICPLTRDEIMGHFDTVKIVNVL